MAEIIEFYVPRKHVAKWHPIRGVLIEFPRKPLPTKIVEVVKGIIVTDSRPQFGKAK